MRGYYGIGIYNPKKDSNLGTLWRSAHILGARYMFTIGRKYKVQSSDTTKAWRHIPLFFYSDLDHFLASTPRGCVRVGIEIAPYTLPIREFKHPERCVYLLGREDYGLPPDVMSRMEYTVQLPGDMCLNVAVAGSLVMYDRLTKGNEGQQKIQTPPPCV